MWECERLFEKGVWYGKRNIKELIIDGSFIIGNWLIIELFLVFIRFDFIGKKM